MDTTYTKTKVDSTTIKISVAAKPQTTAQKIWDNFLAVNASQKAKAQKGAKDKWGVAPMDWYIYRKVTMEQYAPIYEYIYNSAKIHSLSPEFMHSVTMGEGLHLLLEDLRSTIAPFDPLFVIDAYSYLGADEIGSNIDKLIT